MVILYLDEIIGEFSQLNFLLKYLFTWKLELQRETETERYTQRYTHTQKYEICPLVQIFQQLVHSPDGSSDQC